MRSVTSNPQKSHESIIIEAPAEFSAIHRENFYSVFLAGSIENGKADDWQSKLGKSLIAFDNVVVLNPRRRNWDPDLDGNDLKHQIMWEQQGIGSCDIVVFYFDPSTKSPISLLELGQCLGAGKRIVVFCPPAFFRYTNVKVTCHGYSVPVHVDYNTFLAEIIARIT